MIVIRAPLLSLALAQAAASPPATLADDRLRACMNEAQTDPAQPLR